MILDIVQWLWPIAPGFVAGCFFRLSRIVLVAAIAIAVPVVALGIAIALSLSTMAMLSGIALMLTFSAGLLASIGACLGAAVRRRM